MDINLESMVNEVINELYRDALCDPERCEKIAGLNVESIIDDLVQDDFFSKMQDELESKIYELVRVRLGGE